MTKLLTFGFEIEGEFTETLMRKLEEKKLGSMVSDGSVNRCSFGNEWHEKHKHSYETRELNSKVFKVSELDEAKRLFLQLKLDGQYHWNSSAGFHIHTQFDPITPQEIVSSQFCKFFIKKMKENFPFEFEARKNNRYCKLYNTDDRTVYQNNNKYTFINIGASLNEHKTIEFRIFPADEPMRMYKYLEFTINTIENFLKKNIRIEINGKIPLSSEQNKKIKRIKEFVRLKSKKFDIDKEVCAENPKINYDSKIYL